MLRMSVPGELVNANTVKASRNVTDLEEPPLPSSSLPPRKTAVPQRHCQAHLSHLNRSEVVACITPSLQHSNTPCLCELFAKRIIATGNSRWSLKVTDVSQRRQADSRSTVKRDPNLQWWEVDLSPQTGSCPESGMAGIGK